MHCKAKGIKGMSHTAHKGSKQRPTHFKGKKNSN